jgi:hypothetical protein
MFRAILKVLGYLKFVSNSRQGIVAPLDVRVV